MNKNILDEYLNYLNNINNKNNTFKEQLSPVLYKMTTDVYGAGASKGAISSLYAMASKSGVSVLLPQIGIGLTAAAISALIIYAAYKTYQRFFSKAAKACKGFKSKEKTLCMNKVKIASLKKLLDELKVGFVACNKTKDSEKCKIKIAKKYGKINRQIVELTRRN
jgi:mannitol-specific phosphotransferase system IIBC component